MSPNFDPSSLSHNIPGCHFLSFFFFLKTASVGESSEETPSPEVPNAFHSAMSVEAALDLLVTHLTHGQVLANLHMSHFHSAYQACWRCLNRKECMHILSVRLVSRRHWRVRRWQVISGLLHNGCWMMARFTGKALEAFCFAWSAMHAWCLLSFLTDPWESFKKFSAQPIIQ